MARRLFRQAKVDRKHFAVETLADQGKSELAYWRKQSPVQRLEALELLRQLNYDYDPDTTRLSRLHFSTER